MGINFTFLKTWTEKTFTIFHVSKTNYIWLESPYSSGIARNSISVSNVPPFLRLMLRCQCVKQSQRGQRIFSTLLSRGHCGHPHSKSPWPVFGSWPALFAHGICHEVVSFSLVCSFSGGLRWIFNHSSGPCQWPWCNHCYFPKPTKTSLPHLSLLQPPSHSSLLMS